MPPFIYDGKTSWEEYSVDDECICGLFKCLLLLPATNIRGFQGITVCTYCDKPTEDIDPLWRIPNA